APRNGTKPKPACCSATIASMKACVSVGEAFIVACALRRRHAAFMETRTPVGEYSTVVQRAMHSRGHVPRTVRNSLLSVSGAIPQQTVGAIGCSSAASSSHRAPAGQGRWLYSWSYQPRGQMPLLGIQ